MRRNSTHRLVLGAAMTLLLTSCIEAGRGPAGQSDALVTRCEGDQACDDGNACTIDRCDGGTCVQTPVEAGGPCVVGESEACVAGTWHPADACDDAGSCVDGGSVDCATAARLGACQDATCDPALGCGVTTRPAGAHCVAEDGLSDACHGDKVYYREDTCDERGVCVEGGLDDCLSGACATSTCTPGAGCTLQSEAPSGTPCLEGYSKMCVDGTYHAADRCAAGACVDGAVTPCFDSFCHIGSCGAVGCVSTPIGVQRDIRGAYSVFALRQEAALLVLLHGAIAFDDAVWAREGEVAASGVTDGWARSGAYCVSSAGALQLSIGADRPATLSATEVAGQLSPDGRVFAATSPERRTLVIGVRRGAIGAVSLAGRWRMIALMKGPNKPAVGVSGLLTLLEGGCVSSYNLTRSDGLASESGTFVPGDCLVVEETTGRATLSFTKPYPDYLPTDTWIGQVTGDQRFAVLAPTSKDSGLPLPGLLVLVREQPEVAASGLDGDYALAALGLDAGQASSTAGMLSYDGPRGRVTGVSLIDSAGHQLTAGGAPGDVFDFSDADVDGTWGMLRQTVTGTHALEWNGQAGPLGVDGKVGIAIVYDAGTLAGFEAEPARPWLGVLLLRP